MPYGRCVIYTFPGDAEEIVGKARTGILPVFKLQPGFIAYGVMVRGNQLISMSAWRSESDAKAADEVARDWVSKNVDMTVVNSFIGDYEWLECPRQCGPPPSPDERLRYGRAAATNTRSRPYRGLYGVVSVPLAVG